jgi:hypothetical protein
MTVWGYRHYDCLGGTSIMTVWGYRHYACPGIPADVPGRPANAFNKSRAVQSRMLVAATHSTGVNEALYHVTDR